MDQSEEEGTGRGHVQVEEQAVEGNGPKWRPVVGQVCRGEMALSPSFQLAQVTFEPNLYLYKYPSNLVPVILFAHKTYEDDTECSKMQAPKRKKTIFTTQQKFEIRMLEEFHHLITSNKLELIYGMVRTEPRDILSVKSFVSL